MGRRLLVGLLGMPAWGLAFALLVGAGVLRDLPPVLVSAGAVALLLLPAAGLARLLRMGPGGTAVGLVAWGAAVLLGYPLYAPGERGEALVAGLGVVAGALGARPDPAAVLRLEARLPSLGEGDPPPARAERAGEDGPPPVTARPLEADEVALPYEGSGSTLQVPVVLEGPGGRTLEAWMTYDTGATLTAIDRATLARLGVDVPDDAPRIEVRTAAGPRTAPVVLLPRVWLGGVEVEGVTASVCDECADDDTVGLLGLNVSGRFLVTVDHARRELVLRPRADADDRTLDVSPWVTVSGTVTHWNDGRVEVEVTADNRAPRAVSEIEVEVRCDGTWLARVPPVAPGGSGRATVSLPPGTDCDGGTTLALRRAAW